MKKLSIAHIVLGVIIIAISCYILWWMISGVSHLLSYGAPRYDKGTGTIFSFGSSTLFSITRYASILLLVSGIVVLATGLVQTIRKQKQSWKLPALQTACGGLLVITSLFVSRWGYPLSFESIISESNNIVRITNINPGPPLVYAIDLTAVLIVISLAVLVCGITQLVFSLKERKSEIHGSGTQGQSLRA